jgi:hypothetical protein
MADNTNNIPVTNTDSAQPVKNFFNRPNEMKIINLDDKFFPAHSPITETF